MVGLGELVIGSVIQGLASGAAQAWGQNRLTSNSSTTAVINTPQLTGSMDQLDSSAGYERALFASGMGDLRRASRAEPKKNRRKNILRDASFNFQNSMNCQSMGSHGRAASAFLYSLTLAAIGETTEAAEILRGEIAARAGLTSFYIQSVSLQTYRPYDLTQCSLQIDLCTFGFAPAPNPVPLYADNNLYMSSRGSFSASTAQALPERRTWGRRQQGTGNFELLPAARGFTL